MDPYAYDFEIWLLFGVLWRSHIVCFLSSRASRIGSPPMKAASQFLCETCVNLATGDCEQEETSIFVLLFFHIACRVMHWSAGHKTAKKGGNRLFQPYLQSSMLVRASWSRLVSIHARNPLLSSPRSSRSP